MFDVSSNTSPRLLAPLRFSRSISVSHAMVIDRVAILLLTHGIHVANANTTMISQFRVCCVNGNLVRNGIPPVGWTPLLLEWESVLVSSTFMGFDCGILRPIDGSQSPVTPMGVFDQSSPFLHPSASQGALHSYAADIQTAYPQATWLTYENCLSQL